MKYLFCLLIIASNLFSPTIVYEQSSTRCQQGTIALFKMVGKPFLNLRKKIKKLFCRERERHQDYFSKTAKNRIGYNIDSYLLI